MKILSILNSLFAILNSVAVRPVNAAVSGGDIEEHLGGGWPFSDLGKVLSSFLQIATITAGILVFVYLLLGGIKYISSGGDEKAVTSAKNQITTAIVGLLLVVSAYAITKIVERVFGVSILGGIELPRP